VEKITRRFPPLLGKRSEGKAIGFEQAFATLFAEINAALHYLGESYEECRGMGATLSIAWFSGGRMHFAHIGDTRIYHLPAAGGIVQVTKDDTHVGWLQRTGQISEREARMHPAKNRLQKALGAGNQFVDPQVGEIACAPGDGFLLCTDGVTDALFNDKIREVLSECPKGRRPPATSCRRRSRAQAGTTRPPCWWPWRIRRSVDGGEGTVGQLAEKLLPLGYEGT